MGSTSPGRHRWTYREVDGWQSCQHEGCAVCTRGGVYRVKGHALDLPRSPGCPTTLESLRESPPPPAPPTRDERLQAAAAAADRLHEALGGLCPDDTGPDYQWGFDLWNEAGELRRQVHLLIERARAGSAA